MEKLAIYGGLPVLDHAVGYGRQCVDETDIQAVLETLKSDYLTCGPATALFEKAISDATGAKYVTAVANGTAALHVACLAAGICPGDEVIVSSITFAASANCVRYVGATPIFADIDPCSWNINCNAIERYITKKTKAIIAVDFGGVPVNAKCIRSICDKYGLTFIEDAAHAIGSHHYDGRKVGSVADITCFSFHPVKTITSGEGGAVCTNDAAIAKSVELYAKHGITRRPEWMNEPDVGGWHYEQLVLGYNYRISDIEAALGASQLGRLSEFALRRKSIVSRYDEAFESVQEISTQFDVHPETTVRHLYVLRFKLSDLGVSRRWLYNAMQAEGVGVNVHYIPVYQLPYYSAMGYKQDCCPEANRYYEEAITIPLHCCLTADEIEGIIHAVKKIVAYCRGRL